MLEGCEDAWGVLVLTAQFCTIGARSAGWETSVTVGQEASATFRMGTSLIGHRASESAIRLNLNALT
jgi:hypothetical protein